MVLAVADHYSQEIRIIFGTQYLEHKLPICLYKAQEELWYDAVRDGICRSNMIGCVLSTWFVLD